MYSGQPTPQPYPQTQDSSAMCEVMPIPSRINQIRSSQGALDEMIHNLSIRLESVCAMEPPSNGASEVRKDIGPTCALEDQLMTTHIQIDMAYDRINSIICRLKL